MRDFTLQLLSINVFEPPISPTDTFFKKKTLVKQ